MEGNSMEWLGIPMEEQVLLSNRMAKAAQTMNKQMKIATQVPKKRKTTNHMIITAI